MVMILKTRIVFGPLQLTNFKYRFLEQTNSAVQGPVTSAFWAKLDAESGDKAAQETLLASVGAARRALRSQVRLRREKLPMNLSDGFSFSHGHEFNPTIVDMGM